MHRWRYPSLSLHGMKFIWCCKRCLGSAYHTNKRIPVFVKDWALHHVKPYPQPRGKKAQSPSRKAFVFLRKQNVKNDVSKYFPVHTYRVRGPYCKH